MAGLSFCLFIEAFDGVPIPIGAVVESAAVSAERFVEPWCAIDKKHGVFNVVFLAEFSEECVCENVHSRRFKLFMEQIV